VETTPETAVAVIIPSYNTRKTLRACLEAVYGQTYQPAEVLVVDDGSTDGSGEIAREFPCAVLELPGNRGPSAARNAGVAATTAPLLFFVDADTALEPDAIQNAVKAFRDTPDCGMVQGIYGPEPLYDDGWVEAYRVACEHLDRKRSVATLLSDTLIPRKVWEETGGLDERLRDGEDFEFGTRVPSRYRLVVTDTVVTRADDVDRFWACLWERFIRATTMPIVFARARRLNSDAVGFRLEAMSPPRDRRRPPRLSSALASLSLLMVPLAVFTPWLRPVPVLLFVAFVASHVYMNWELISFARRLRGARFAVFVAWIHMLYLAAFFVGVAVGVLRMIYLLRRGQGEPIQPAHSPSPPIGVRR
jgi:glycosyltransferase involved in cell wall biosynthesis